MSHPPWVSGAKQSEPANVHLRLQRSAAVLAQSQQGLRWAPLVAALAIDLADLATAGPIGLFAGVFVGGLLTTMVSMAAGAKASRALLFGALGGLYCALPFTEVIPLATVLTLVHGLISQQPEPAQVEARVIQTHPPQR